MKKFKVLLKVNDYEINATSEEIKEKLVFFDNNEKDTKIIFDDNNFVLERDKKDVNITLDFINKKQVIILKKEKLTLESAIDIKKLYKEGNNINIKYYIEDNLFDLYFCKEEL